MTRPRVVWLVLYGRKDRERASWMPWGEVYQTCMGARMEAACRVDRDACEVVRVEVPAKKGRRA